MKDLIPFMKVKSTILNNEIVCLWFDGWSKDVVTIKTGNMYIIDAIWLHQLST